MYGSLKKYNQPLANTSGIQEEGIEVKYKNYMFRAKDGDLTYRGPTLSYSGTVCTAQR